MKESYKVRVYRRQVASQNIVYPLQERRCLKSDSTRSRTVFGSLVSCHSRTISPLTPDVTICGFVNNQDTFLFSLPEKLWSVIHSNSALMSLFDAAIVGSNAADVPGRVASLVREAAASYRCYKAKGGMVEENAQYRDLRRFALSPVFVDDDNSATGIVTSWYPTGLRYCGNNFACPVCSELNARQQRKRIDKVINLAYGNGLLPMMLTFTHSHKSGDSCADGFAVMSAAMRAFRKTAAYKAFVSACSSTFDGKPFLPSFLTTEVVIGKIFYDKYKADVLAEASQRAKQLSLFNPFEGDSYDADAPVEADAAAFFKSHNVNDYLNGWHIHKHGLFFIRRDNYKDYVSLIPALKSAWASCVVDVTASLLGRSLSERSKVFLNAEGLSCAIIPSSTAAYLCKRDKKDRTWGTADELTRSTAKTRGGISPFSLLDNPTPFHAALWREYVTGCRGQRRWQTNKGFDAFFASLAERQQQRQQQRWRLSLSDLRSFATTTLIPWRITVSDIGSILSPSLLVGISPKLDCSVFSGLVRVRVKVSLGKVFAIESEKPLSTAITAPVSSDNGSCRTRYKYYKLMFSGFP